MTKQEAEKLAGKSVVVVKLHNNKGSAHASINGGANMLCFFTIPGVFVIKDHDITCKSCIKKLNKMAQEIEINTINGKP